MLDRGTAAFTLATTAVALAAFDAVLWAFFYPQYWALLLGPGIATAIALGVWRALRAVCTGGGWPAHTAALFGIVLLCAWSILGISFGGTVAMPIALLLMAAHAIVPSPR